VGAITPLGAGAQNLHERWCAGHDGVRDGFARCRDFIPEEWLPRKLVRRSDRFTQLALAAGDEAIAQAGWAEAPPAPPERIGCIVGTGIGGIGTLLGADAVMREQGAERVPPLSIPLMMTNAAPAALAMRHDLRGHVYGTVSACAAGAHAIGVAARAIAHGDCDAVLTGGSEAAHADLAHAAFASMDALSGTGISRPFDARRDGFVMGEGAGMLVLEAADVAEARGATILGEVLGFGATSDAHHLTAPAPDGAGAANAIRLALADAGLGAHDIAYVNAHGTSTPLNDRAETRALKAALGDHAQHVPVSSAKSAIGHLLGAAGAVEAVATVIALRERVAPPTLGWAEREEGLDLDYVPDTPRALKGTVGISNSFGFGGHNAVLCLEGVPA
jgi:3-oxoacyl-[acyl-carrier-protein] synthase II